MARTESREANRSSEDGLIARVDSGIRELLGDMQQGKSERLARYLEFSARFHRYSLYNQMLIYLQCPHATFVAGYHKWQEMGYQVARGEKGIRILAPRTRTITDEETGETREIVRFVDVAVFDASQLANLEEKPLPLFFAPLEDNHPELAARLVRVMEEDGIRVSEGDLGLTQGYSGRGRVNVREGMDSTSKVLTLLHEYAHELLHWTVEGKAQEPKIKECHAEAVSFVTARYFGIRNPFSADYLQHWGNTPKELLAELDVVRRTTAHIIERLESPEERDHVTPSKVEIPSADLLCWHRD